MGNTSLQTRLGDQCALKSQDQADFFSARQSSSCVQIFAFVPCPPCSPSPGITIVYSVQLACIFALISTRLGVFVFSVCLACLDGLASQRDASCKRRFSLLRYRHYFDYLRRPVFKQSSTKHISFFAPLSQSGRHTCVDQRGRERFSHAAVSLFLRGGLRRRKELNSTQMPRRASYGTYAWNLVPRMSLILFPFRIVHYGVHVSFGLASM